MLNHFKNHWKYTVGFMLTIEAGGNTDPTEFLGLTHVAEHMMLSGTKTLDGKELSAEFSRYFSETEATTSHEKVKLFCYFDLADFDKVTAILHDMVFDWYCRKKDFASEKQSLVDEAKDFHGSYQQRRRTAISKILPELSPDDIGITERLQQLSYGDILLAKKHWSKLLRIASRRLLVISGGLSKQQLDHLDKMFLADAPESNYKKQPWQAGAPHIVLSKHAAVLKYTSPVPHLNDILFARILSWRVWRKFPRAESRAYTVDRSQLLDIYDESSVFSRQTIHDIFTKPVSKAEFNHTLPILLGYYRQCLDAVDAIDTMEWIEGFDGVRYAPLYSIDPRKNYQYFAGLTFEEFNKTVRQIQKGIK
ncbi:MAG: insulinase family protein [Parcubacteria group bacterium]|nr:insulinase family protein [Parcubacteria group bacterium]